MGHFERQEATSGAQGCPRRMAGCRMIQDGIKELFHRPPRKEVSVPQRLRQRSKDFIDRTRLALSLKRALHEIEMRVRDLESQLFEPRGSRQYDIGKTPGCLVHEEIDADDQLCLVEALGDVSRVGRSSKTFSRPLDRAS